MVFIIVSCRENSNLRQLDDTFKRDSTNSVNLSTNFVSINSTHRLSNNFFENEFYYSSTFDNKRNSHRKWKKLTATAIPVDLTAKFGDFAVRPTEMSEKFSTEIITKLTASPTAKLVTTVKLSDRQQDPARTTARSSNLLTKSTSITTPTKSSSIIWNIKLKNFSNFQNFDKVFDRFKRKTNTLNFKNYNKSTLFHYDTPSGIPLLPSSSPSPGISSLPFLMTTDDVPEFRFKNNSSQFPSIRIHHRSFNEEPLNRIFNGSLLDWDLSGELSPSSGKVSATDPYIDPATPSRIRAFNGKTAILPCFVNNLGQRSVSWVRHRDIHVLTVGRFTFTNDDRFLAHHEDGSNEWALRLRSPKIDDTGYYECQVNTKPIISRLILLEVLEPEASISGVNELYIKLGSTIELRCSVLNSPSKTDFLLWYHNRKVMNYERGRTVINTSSDGNNTGSSLIITSATGSDSGTYTCSPSNARNASVKVHVINGEHPAAMQTNSGRINLHHFKILLLSLSLVPYLISEKPCLAIGTHFIIRIFYYES
ncbi:UNVERIFIED_CONTAM: hypothetical protein RMT77_013615 [Armadillidium vulgare]